MSVLIKICDQITGPGMPGETAAPFDPNIYKRLVEQINEGALIVDSRGGILYCNSFFAGMLKTSPFRLTGSSLSDLLPAGEQQLKTLLTTDKKAAREITLTTPDGMDVHAFIHSSQLVESGDRLVFCITFTGHASDKSSKEILAAEKLTSSILDMVAEAVVVSNMEGIIIRANKAARDLCNEEPVTQPFDRLFILYPCSVIQSKTGDDSKENANAKRFELIRTLEEKDLHEFEVVYRRSDRNFNLLLSSSPLTESNGETYGHVLTLSNITARKQDQEKLKYLSLHDQLTGLYNRAYFEQEMQRIEKGRYLSVGIIVCDVDGLKLINDTMGHDTGDSLLKTAASIIRDSFRSYDMVARIGGDEFAVLLPNTYRIGVEHACNRVRSSLLNYNEANPEMHLSISLGFAVSSKVSNIRELFKEADNNMYREKLHRKKSARSSVVQTLMKALEVRDFLTEGHADRLQDLAQDLGKAIGLGERNITDLRLLAQFHDIGKVGIPDRILFKTGPLTQEEFKEIQRHCEIGNRIAQAAYDLRHIADWILKHHEWYNGMGYPLGIKGENIPLECRIITIADSYDAMSSNRPYRTGMTQEKVIAELLRCAGTQFDPRLVAMFIHILKTKYYKK